MRIKSYFAPSVQAAIALARKEFGDDVTLVTSHVASLDNRHLGEYEVVFAVEEAIPPSAPELLVEAPAAPVFQELVQQAMQTPLPMYENLEGKLEEIHASLIALGLDSSLVRSFMTMLRAVLPAEPAAPARTEEVLLTPAPEVLEETVLEQPVLEAPMIEEPLPAPAPKPKITVIKPEPAASPSIQAAAPRPFLSLFEAARPEPRFSAAELAFMSSVSSSSKEQKA